MENEIKMSGLAAALAKAQGAIPNPKKDTENPFFKSKYADLAAVWDAARPHLAANGLCFVQMPSADGQKVTVTGKLLHSSGEWLESSITGTAKDGSPQAIGSCITYLRRYQLSAMLGIAAEADDDGNAASGTGEEKRKPGRPAAPKSDPIPQADHGTFEDQIVRVKKTEGKSTATGKPWTLYTVETASHGEFSTFDHAVAEAARLAHDSGEWVMVDSEPTNKGPKINGVRSIPEIAPA